jgi:hypothetical protein
VKIIRRLSESIEVVEHEFDQQCAGCGLWYVAGERWLQIYDSRCVATTELCAKCVRFAAAAMPATPSPASKS